MNKLFKKAFTLIELIVVIIVLGILAAIVVPNISSWQKEADNARTIADVRNLQTSVDTYAVKNQNQHPTYYPAALGNPAPIDMDKIHPDYVRNLPKGKDMKYWMDYTGTVWASPIDAPEEVSYQAGELTWKAIEEAALYRIYATAPVSLSGSVKKVSKLHLVKEVTESKLTLPALPEGDDYLVSAVDGNGFETPAVTGVYKGYKVEGNPAPVEITRTPAPAGMEGYLVPADTSLQVNGVYSANIAAHAIDGDLSTGWGPADWQGFYEMIFKEKQHLTGIQLAPLATPSANMTYNISGLQDGVWKQIGTTNGWIEGSATILKPIQIPEGDYDGIRIDVPRGASWVAIMEITLLNKPFPAPVQMQGFRLPAGTTMWSSGYYSSYTPDKTMDGNIDTYWNSGDYTGAVEYRFPKGEFLKGIQVAAGSGPADNREYVIYGLKGGQWSQIGIGTRYVGSGISILEPIAVTPDTYDAIKLEMKRNSSWVAINEVSIIK